METSSPRRPTSAALLEPAHRTQCTFRDGADIEHILRGTWKLLPNDELSRSARGYANLSCPIAWSKYDCAFQRADGADFSDFRYLPNACTLPRQSILELLDRALAENRALHFRGDSLAREHFISMSCLSRDSWSKGTSVRWTRTPRGAKLVEQGGGHKLTPCHGVPKCIETGQFSTWENKWSLSISLTRGRKLTYNGRTLPNLRAGDIVVTALPSVADQVMMWGQNMTERLQYIEKIVRGVAGEIKALRARGVIVVHREASPQHFQCAGPSGRGSDVCDGVFDGAEATRYNGCAAALGRLPAAIRIEREVLLPLTRGGKIAYVPTMDMLQRWGDSHVGGGPCNGGRCGFRDCTHWCLPGPPDEWSRMVLVAAASFRTHLL